MRSDRSNTLVQRDEFQASADGRTIRWRVTCGLCRWTMETTLDLREPLRISGAQCPRCLVGLDTLPLLTRLAEFGKDAVA